MPHPSEVSVGFDMSGAIVFGPASLGHNSTGERDSLRGSVRTASGGEINPSGDSFFRGFASQWNQDAGRLYSGR